jgi:hypothetical protein
MEQIRIQHPSTIVMSNRKYYTYGTEMFYHFATALGKHTSDVLFWADTVVNSPREMRGVRLAIARLSSMTESQSA